MRHTVLRNAAAVRQGRNEIPNDYIRLIAIVAPAFTYIVKRARFCDLP